MLGGVAVRYDVAAMGAPHDLIFDVPGRVVLAHARPFALGPLLVDPPRRQVGLGEASETLEPRVMQVLVALARAGGEIVTRDELIENCWDSRIVGDDSINRVLARIRRLAAGIGGGSFSVETIPKVGYRLEPRQGHQQPDEHLRALRPMPRFSRRALIGGAVAAISLGVVAAAALRSDAVRSEPLPEAKALYDRAVTVRQSGMMSSNREALAFLRQAVRLAPEFGEAWGLLALVYRSAITNEAPERTAGFEQRLGEAVRNARRYDPGNADAAAALLPWGYSFGRWSELERVYRVAIRRNPGHPTAYSLLGSLLMDVGRWGDAVAMLRSAKARDPSSPLIRYKLIVSLWAAGRISAAEVETDEAMKLWPQHGAIWQTKIKQMALSGRPREALAFASDPAAKPLDEVQDSPSQEQRLLFLTAVATGTRRDSERAIEAMLSRARTVEGERLATAINSAALGRTDIALDMLEGMFVGSGEWALWSTASKSVGTHPLFQPHARPLWDQPRFQRILVAVGLEHYWRTSGTVPDFRR